MREKRVSSELKCPGFELALLLGGPMCRDEVEVSVAVLPALHARRGDLPLRGTQGW